MVVVPIQGGRRSANKRTIGVGVLVSVTRNWEDTLDPEEHWCMGTELLGVCACGSALPCF